MLFIPVQVTADTTDIFVEVTSCTSMVDCLATLEELLKEMLLAGFGETFNGTDANELRLEAVRIVDSHGHLKDIYPLYTDTELDRFR